MAPEMTLSEIGREQLSHWFAELRGSDDDFAKFVTQQLDQLQSLADSVAQRERELAVQAQHVDRQLEALCASQQRLDKASAAAEKWTSNLSQPTTPAPTGMPQELIDLLAEMRQTQQHVSAELSTVKADTLAIVKSAAEDFGQARTELLAMTAELRQARALLEEAATAMTAAPAMPAQCVPATAAELPINAGDNHQAPATTAPVEEAAEPAGWWGELQQLRRGLAKSASPAGKHATKAPAPTATTNPRNAPQGEEPALGAILEQFESLQSELSSRRGSPAAKAPSA